MRITTVGYLALLALSQPTVLMAQAADKPVVEKLAHGEINWTTKSVQATGSGAANLNLPNVAAIRLNAERAAKLDAYRNILETLKGIRVSAKQMGKEALAKQEIKAQVEGIVRGCKVVDTHYYSDGGVDVVLRCPLDGGLATSLAPVGGQKPVTAEGPNVYTGLVVDARGLGVKPALQPRVVDPDGAELYAATMVAPNALRQYGAATFVRSVDAAKKVKRVGDKPLIIRAKRAGKVPSDVVIDAGSMARVQGQNQSFLAEAKVVIVTDGQ